MNDRELIEKYRHFFPESAITKLKNGNDCITNLCLAFGFEVPDEWLPIIEEVFEKFNALPDDIRNNISVFQIKEKFGTLRIYLDGYFDETETIIDEAEKKVAELKTNKEQE